MEAVVAHLMNCAEMSGASDESHESLSGFPVFVLSLELRTPKHASVRHALNYP